MNEIKIHMQKLSKMCRLCKQIIIIDQSYVHKKTALEFSKEIFDIFGHHVKDDCENIHPKFLCNNCRRKLQCYQKSPYVAFPVDVADFTKHKTVICLICSGHANKHIYKIESSGVLKDDLNKSNNTSLSPIPSPITSFDKFVEIASMYKFMKTCEGENCYYLSKVEISVIPVIERSLKIYKNFSWDIIAYNLLISKANPYLALIPEIIYEENIHEFFMAVSELKICPANDEFQDLISYKLSYGSELHFLDKDKIIKGTIENKLFSSEADLKVIRSSKCDKLISNYITRCNHCTALRKDLIVYSHRYETDKTGSKEKSPNIYKNREQLLQKCEDQHNYLRYLKNVLKKKEKKIQKLFEKESIILPDKLNDVVSGIFKNNGNHSFPRDSPKYLLWQEQLKNCGLKNKKSARWHPLFIRFCLSLYLKSPAAYEHIRNSGFIELPHRTTLNQYTGFASSSSGFVAEIVSRLCLDLKIEMLKDHERQTIIMFDEMKIKQNLVFCPTSGELRGFTELGDMNEELNEFDRCFNLETQKTKDLASHILCVMVGGLLKRFTYPLAYFCTAGLSSDQLFPIIWKAVGISESIGLEVVAIVSDGASMNRRFFKLHELADGSNVSVDGVVYWVYNRYDMDRKIFFFSDPPHLLKTLRNNLENSGSNSFTRNLTCNGKSLNWQQLVDLYDCDLGRFRIAPGLRRLHRLTQDHMFLTPRLRMRVYLAAQVLSSTVADAIAHRNMEQFSELEKFIRLTDMFFDILNVNNKFQGQKSRKPALYPYRALDDWRFDWLQNTYLKYINEWKAQAESSEGIPKEMKTKLCLSSQTIKGIRITVHSFVELVPYLLSRLNDGQELYFLSDKLNQDSVEEHFGRIRSRGGANENPTAHEYGLLNRKVIVIKSDLLKVMRGNTRGCIREKFIIDVNDNRELPKRVKRKNKLE